MYPDYPGRVIHWIFPKKKFCCAFPMSGPVAMPAVAFAFDTKGNLYITVGDNTNPFATNYAPLDDRPGRQNFDAQRTAANTKDLRGKVLRIHPEPDGSYTIPAGNLFRDTTQKDGRKSLPWDAVILTA
jgi:glucose/arabinose dehydrogenase